MNRHFTEEIKMANKNMKRFSMKFHYGKINIMLTILAKTLKSESIKSSQALQQEKFTNNS